jgi:hypothetical protein
MLKAYPQQTIKFVEDRLPTLLNVQKEPELASVKLLFANWGYNTEEDKSLAALKGFKVLSLQDFV